MLSLSGENRKGAAQLFTKIRKDHQGLASIVTVIEAEPEYASDYAMEEARKITAILGIFSDATLLPNIKCVSNIKGAENIARATEFSESEEEEFTMSNSIMDKSSAKYWRLDRRRIREIREEGLDKISSLLASDSLKDFEQSVLNSFFLYSKSAFTADPVEKVVHILSSLESILLKNENEANPTESCRADCRIYISRIRRKKIYNKNSEISLWSKVKVFASWAYIFGTGVGF